MSRIPLPFHVDDVSALARGLRHRLEALERAPSHVEMLNLLTRAGGYRNFQHFKAQQGARKTVGRPTPQPAEINFDRVKKIARCFDAQGQLVRWPKKFTQRMLCLWVLWSRIAPKTSYNEREISDFLEKQHLFGDHALLRRELVDRGMVDRTADGREYKRREVQPPAETLELLRLLRR